MSFEDLFMNMNCSSSPGGKYERNMRPSYYFNYWQLSTGQAHIYLEGHLVADKKQTTQVFKY